MPDGSNRELWPDGAPDQGELLQYLVLTLGLTHEDARQVSSRYHEPETGGFGGSSDVEWTESRLAAWVNAQPEVRATVGAGQSLGGALSGSDLSRGAIGDVRRSMAGEPERSATAWERLHDQAQSDSEERVQRAAHEADRAVTRAQGVRDRFYKAGRSVGFDSGPGMDPAALSQSLAVGVFTDASGNPVIDPDTGQPTEVNAQTLWGAIKGQTFDMGTLALPRVKAPKGRAGREGDDARLARLERVQNERRTFITPSMAMALLGNMDDDGVIKIQQQLWEAGLFGEDPPSWGVADETTRKAYMALFAEASLTPDEPIDRVLARLTDDAVTRGTTTGGDQAQLPAFKPEVASKETLSRLVDDLAQNLTGAFVDDATKNKLISDLQAKEIDTQRAQYDRDVAEATSGGGGPAGGIDAFMNAIAGRESGGDYGAVNSRTGAAGKFQIMPGNWGPWAERAGIGRNAPRTPQNQEVVARHVMTEYYQRFGNWRDVAIAWFAGPGAVGAAGAERRSDGNMTVRQYADDVMSRMAAAGGGVGGAGAAVGATQAIETFDPQAEAEARLKMADPAGWAGHEYAQRAVDYFSLLQGVV